MRVIGTLFVVTCFSLFWLVGNVATVFVNHFLAQQTADLAVTDTRITRSGALNMRSESLKLKKKQNDTDGIRTHAGRAQRLSRPPP